MSHALWAGLAGEAGRRRWQAGPGAVAGAVVFGVAPDAVALAPVLGWALTQADPAALVTAYIWAMPGSEPTLPFVVAELAHHAHCFMHSAVIAALATIIAWVRRPALLLPLSGWWTHIVLDVATHSDDYYAVPFLYPFSTWGIDGIEWTNPWVLVLNYAALASAYAAIVATRRSPRY